MNKDLYFLVFVIVAGLTSMHGMIHWIPYVLTTNIEDITLNSPYLIQGILSFLLILIVAFGVRAYDKEKYNNSLKPWINSNGGELI